MSSVPTSIRDWGEQQRAVAHHAQVEEVPGYLSQAIQRIAQVYSTNLIRSGGSHGCKEEMRSASAWGWQRMCGTLRHKCSITAGHSALARGQELGVAGMETYARARHAAQCSLGVSVCSGGLTAEVLNDGHSALGGGQELGASGGDTQGLCAHACSVFGMQAGCSVCVKMHGLLKARRTGAQ